MRTVRPLRNRIRHRAPFTICYALEKSHDNDEVRIGMLAAPVYHRSFVDHVFKIVRHLGFNAAPTWHRAIRTEQPFEKVVP